MGQVSEDLPSLLVGSEIYPTWMLREHERHPVYIGVRVHLLPARGTCQV